MIHTITSPNALVFYLIVLWVKVVPLQDKWLEG